MKAETIDEETVTIKTGHYESIVSNLDKARREADFYKVKYESLNNNESENNSFEKNEIEKAMKFLRYGADDSIWRSGETAVDALIRLASENNRTNNNES